MKRIFLYFRIFIVMLLLLIGAVATFLLPNVYYVPSEGAIRFLGEAPEVSTPGRMLAYISGAVVNPGVYEFSSGDRVGNLIELAGGLVAEADQAILQKDINLANLLSDGQHVYIPFVQEAGGASAEGNQGTVNLNTATIEELMSLPGVGESTAAKIQAARPFSQIEDLLNVPGIGEAKFAQLKDLVGV